MANKNYVRGRIAEYRLMKELEAEGHIVCRSAGSKGSFDLIAVKGSEIRFIQVKRTKCKNPRITIEEAKKELGRANFGSGDILKVSKEIYVWRDYKGWLVEKV